MDWTSLANSFTSAKPLSRIHSSCKEMRSSCVPRTRKLALLASSNNIRFSISAVCLLLQLTSNRTPAQSASGFEARWRTAAHSDRVRQSRRGPTRTHRLGAVFDVSSFIGASRLFIRPAVFHWSESPAASIGQEPVYHSDSPAGVQ